MHQHRGRERLISEAWGVGYVYRWVDLGNGTVGRSIVSQRGG